MKINNQLLEKAIIYATKKHGGQTRKGNGLPYIIHPLGVMSILLEVKESKNITMLLTAIVLHDISEDCNVSIKTIAKKFGHQIAALVEELTLDKEKYVTIGKTELLCQEIINMSSYALCIKLADRLYNVRDTKSMSVDFREKYFKETQVMLNTLESDRKLTKTHKKLIKMIKKVIN
jgi:(p)ppGpp synthase/HD superfamily hydrolase